MVDNKKMEWQLKSLATPKESSIEKKLVEIVAAKNGMCIKQTGQKAMPDRLCLLPGERVWFVETKRPGKKPDPLQLFTHTKLRKMGFMVSVIWNAEQLKQFESEIQAL